MSDRMVLATQEWLNTTYGNDSRFVRVTENGNTGWNTIYGLRRALQIELGIQSTSTAFGPSTTAKFNERFPNGIAQQNPDDSTQDNIYAIIQGALWCKGYSTGASSITKNFYSGTGNAIKSLKTHAGSSSSSSSTVTLNVMKALLSMDQFVKVSGGSTTIRTIQQNLNNEYENYIGLSPCDGVYGREMNLALIKVLQAIEGYSVADATGNFGSGTKANLPIVPSNGALNEQTEKKAIKLIRYALCCNGYDVSITSEIWDSELSTAIQTFQSDMCITVASKCTVDTWCALLISKGNTDRNCNACDTAYTMRDDRLDALSEKGIGTIGRYITGGSAKELDDGEIERIINRGFKFFPIYQVNGTPGINQFTTASAIENARIARIKAKSYHIPDNSIIYFAVDFDPVDTEISNVIVPYFKTLKENIGCYKIGIYGTRNVCSQVLENNYAETCFVSDMSTGYSGNMGFKMPENWNLDQFHEMQLAATNGNFGIDKVTYSGRYPVVEQLTNDIGIRGYIEDFSFTSHHVGNLRAFSGNKMKVYVSATKVSSNIPDNAVVLVKIVPTQETQLISRREIIANLDGNIHTLSETDYMRIGDGYSIGCEYYVAQKMDEQNEDGSDKYQIIENAEVNVHIEFETEY